MTGQDRTDTFKRDFRTVAITLPLLPVLAMPIPAFALDTGMNTKPEIVTLYGIPEARVANEIVKNVVGNEDDEIAETTTKTQDSQKFEADEELDTANIAMTTKYGIGETFPSPEMHSYDSENPDEEDTFDGETSSNILEDEAEDEMDTVEGENEEASANANTSTQTADHQQMSSADVLLYILCTIAGVVAVGAAAMYFSGRSKKESGE